MAEAIDDLLFIGFPLSIYLVVNDINNITV